MTREAVVTTTLVRLADTLAADFDEAYPLRLLTERCVELFDVTAAGLLVGFRGDDLRAVSSTDDTAHRLGLLEVHDGEGPGIDCYRSAAPVVNQVFAAEGGPWPTFAPKALDAGYRSVCALPLRLRDQTIGALDLFRTGTDRLSADDLLAAQAFADVATIAALQHRAATEAQSLNEQLHHALNSRIAIEQAKGMVAERAGVGLDRAFEMLRGHARSHNLRLADLAQQISAGGIATSILDVVVAPARRRGSWPRPGSVPSGITRVFELVEAAGPADAVDVAAAELLSTLGAEWISFLMADLGGESLVRLRFPAQGDESRVAAPPRGQADRPGRLESVKLAGSPYERVLATQAVQVAPEGARFRVFAPVSDRGEAQGVLEVLVATQPTDAFVKDVERAAHALAYVVIANRRHTDRFESMQRHAPFSLAAEIQRRLLPAAFTCETPHFTLAGWLEPAEQVGGDTFDYSVERGVLHASMTDAMGRGVTAAQLATLVVASLRNGRRADVDLAEQAQWANDAMALHAGPDQFVTGLLVRVDLSTGAVRAVNAGHPRPYRLRGGRVICLDLEPDVPLGAVVGYPYRVQDSELLPGDRLVVVTDGVVARQSPSAHLGVAAAVGETAALHPREMVHAFKESVGAATETFLDDDAAVLCIDWHGG